MPAIVARYVEPQFRIAEPANHLFNPQHRKLACDPSLDCCNQCQRVNAWCTVTDPLTNTPTYRGEFEYLERRVAKQHDDMQELLAKLRSLGEDVSAYQDDGDEATKRYNAWLAVKASGDTRPWDRDERQGSSLRIAGHQNHKSSPNAQAGGLAIGELEAYMPLDASINDALSLPDVRTGVTRHNFVGVFTSKEPQSSGTKSKLNMLGWEIDLSSFEACESMEGDQVLDSGQPLYDRSYRSSIATMHGVNPRLPKVDLPPKEEAFELAAGFFLVIGSFVPILHKPTYMNMVRYQPKLAGNNILLGLLTFK